MNPASLLLLVRSAFALPLAGLLLSGSVWGTIPDDPEIIQARKQFLAAEKALQQDQQQTYQRLVKQLQNYPLLPYLEYQELTKHLSSRSPESIQAALEQLADTPLSDRLRGAWLDQLAKTRQWHTYLEFAGPGGSVKRQCLRLQALIETGQQRQAFDKAPAIWLSGIKCLLTFLDDNDRPQDFDYLAKLGTQFIPCRGIGAEYVTVDI